MIDYDQAQSECDNAGGDQDPTWAGGGTVMFWCDLVDAGDAGGFGRILSQGFGTGGRGWDVFVSNDNQLRFSVNTDGNQGVWASPTNSVPFAALKHCAITYDSDNLTTDPLMYVDGSSETVSETGTPTGTILAPNDEMMFGNIIGLNRNMDGELGGVRFYDRALTANQILQVFEGRGSDSVRAGRVRDWLMSELVPGTSMGATSVREALAGQHSTAATAGTYWAGVLSRNRGRAAY